MRTQLFTTKLLATASIIFIFLSGCFKDKLTKTYSIMYPIYASKSEVLASISGNGPEAIKEPGKLYIYGKYIFLNEINKGVHVIDNTDPSKPINISFIKIPGNVDIAVKGNILYADLYTDMLAIDITQPMQAKVTKLIPDLFPERQYFNGFVADTSLVIVDWLKKDTTVEVDRSFPNIWGGCINCAFALDAGAKSNSSGSAAGIAGSMSRFAVVNDYLYAVNMSTLQAVSVSNPSQPEVTGKYPLGWNIETIYPFKNKLFIGSATGMFAFNINTPEHPVLEGSFNHSRACDPVVADDDYAFVTLRAGTFCQGTANQLDIINISNLSAPSLIKTYGMTNPHGLAKDGNNLFICDGSDGLKMYDISNVRDIKLKQHIKGIETYDVIAFDKKLMVVTKDGLRQYDYSNQANIKMLSNLPILRD